MKRFRGLARACLFGPGLSLVTFACTGGVDRHSPSLGGQGGAPPTTSPAGQGGALVETGGSSVGGSVGGGGGVAGQMLDGLLVDDFEDGDDVPLIPGGTAIRIQTAAGYPR
jgi:hypothetical protein